MDYQISFVGRATMLSLEGILSASSTAKSSVDWWFKKTTINWCNADLEYNEESGMDEIDGHSKEYIESGMKSLDDPKDIICAYEDTKIIKVIDPKTGEITENEETAIFVNPARIFRRIMAAYNRVYPNSFPVAEIEECRWVKGLDTIQQDETTAEYINRVLCKNAVTYTNNGSDNYKDQVAGFQYFVDGDGHHFKRLNYMSSNTINTIELHFGTQDSRVISFTAANVGALVMAGYHKNDYDKLLAESSSMDKLYGELITSGGENVLGSSNETSSLQSSEIISSNYFTDMLLGDKNDLVNPTSSSNADSLSAEYTANYTELDNLPFEAQLTIWGEYSNDIKPGNFIELLTYDTNGQKHYTTGNYYITEVIDDVSNEGFIQTITMIKNLSAYREGSINADDNTSSSKEDYTEGRISGSVYYTVPQNSIIDLMTDRNKANSNLPGRTIISRTSSVGGR